MTKKTKAAHTPGPQPVGLNEGNGLLAQRCAKCRTLCAPEIIIAPLGWCPLCVEPVRKAAPDLLAALKLARIDLDNLEAIGWCDHAVNICVCGLVSNLEVVDAAIAKAEGR